MSDNAMCFKPVSLGIATENITRDTRNMQVLPIDFAPATDGEVTFNPETNTYTGTDSTGKTFSVNSTTTRELDCEWLPYDDNRATPPNIRRGEILEIYRLADTTQYFWRSCNFRNGLRTLETAIFLYNANPDAAGGGVSFDDAYYQVFSAHEGHITIGTSKKNNEAFAYVFQINTKENSVIIQDDIGNEITLDSTERQIKLINADNSFLNIEKKFIQMSADQYILFKCGGTTFRMDPATIASNCSGEYKITSGSYTMDTAEVTVTSTIVSWSCNQFMII